MNLAQLQKVLTYLQTGSVGKLLDDTAADLLATALGASLDNLRDQPIPTLIQAIITAMQSGGGVCPQCPQDMEVVWTPTSAALGELMGFFAYGDLPGIGPVLTFDQTHMLSGVDLEPGTGTFAGGITEIHFPNLVDVDPTGANSGYFTLIDFPNLTVISAPNFVTYWSTVNFANNPSLTTVNLSSFLPTDGRGISIQGGALLAASVNQVLARGVANPAFVSGLVDLSGGTNAAPTGQGIADKATLIGRGVTVNTN